ncbi:MAG: SIMPL domain-containing protein [Methyloligellaceae bacterium]
MFRNVFLLIPILGLLMMGTDGGALAASGDNGRTISLAGTGVAKARPDTAHISTGVISEGPTAHEALEKNSAAMAQVVAELKAQGLEPKDIQTTNFSVHPRYQHFKDGKPSAIVGYRVVNSVRVTVRDLMKLGTVVDKVVGLGSNKIGGIEFSVDDPAPLKSQARKLAMENAISKANLYAEAAGAKLGKVLKISEGVTQRPPRPVFARAAVEAKSATPIEPGQQMLQVRVDVTWELE